MVLCNDATWAWGPKWTQVFKNKIWSLELSPTEQQTLHAKRTFWQPGKKKTYLWEVTSAILKYFIHVEQHVEHPLEIQQKHLGTSWSTTHGRRSLPSFLRGFSGSLFAAPKLCPHMSVNPMFSENLKETNYHWNKQILLTNMLYQVYSWICCFQTVPCFCGPAPRRSPAVRRDSHHGPLSKYPSRSCRQQCDLSKMGKRFRPLNFAGNTGKC